MTDTSNNPTSTTDTEEVPGAVQGSPLVSQQGDEETKLVPEASTPPEPDGRWVADEDDENAIAVSDTAFVGVSDEYKNYADSTLEPLFSEDEELKKAEENAIEVAASLAREVNPNNPRQTYDPETVHPSKAVKPQDKYIDGNRALMERLSKGE